MTSRSVYSLKMLKEEFPNSCSKFLQKHEDEGVVLDSVQNHTNTIVIFDVLLKHLFNLFPVRILAKISRNILLEFPLDLRICCFA